MGETSPSRTMRADNYALSEETKRLRDAEQARLTDEAFAEAIRLLDEAPRRLLDRLAAALLEKETLNRQELDTLLADIEPESRAAETVGTVQALAPRPPVASTAVKRASTTSASRSRISTRRSRPTSGCSAPSSSERADAVTTQGVEAASLTSASGQSSCCASLGTTRRSAGSSPARGPGHAPRRLRGRRSSRRARRPAGRGRRADRRRRRGPASSGCEVAFVHPSPPTASSRSWSPVADRIRIEIGFDGGQVDGARWSPPRPPTRSSKALGAAQERAFSLDVEDGRYTVVARPGRVRQAVLRASGRVGFGA